MNENWIATYRLVQRDPLRSSTHLHSPDMASLAFASRLEAISGNDASDSVKAFNRGPSDDELDAISLADYGNFSGHYYPAITPSGPQTPAEAHTLSSKSDQAYVTPNELEASLPPTPTQHDAVHVVPSWSYPSMNKWRVLAACLQYFGNGMNDSAPGALIPYLESWYHIGYAVVSLIFITNAAGFILSAFFNDTINTRLGRARTLVLSEAFMITGYAIIAASPPFGVVVVAYMILGFGNAMNLALNNVFCANLANSTVILGAAHGSYGIGGILGPIVATLLVANGVHWARFYLVTIGVRALCMVFVAWSSWNYEKEETTQFSNSLQQIASRQAASELGEPSKLKLLGRALKMRVTIVGALFIFAYQGAEVSESGWFISYLINYRNGDPAKVGYVTSGFWAGITLGRFLLTHLAAPVGEKRFVYALGVGVIVFQLLSWLVPNVIGDAGE